MTILVIYVLTVRSSYASNQDEAALEKDYDTVQFFSAQGKCWRIRTYALDDDVHLWSIGADPEDLVMQAEQTTNEKYRDVIRQRHVLQSASGLEGIRTQLDQLGLGAHLNISPAGPVFWTPEGVDYRTKSTP